MSDSRTCPDCQKRLYFMPDGRSLYCEHCGYKQTVEKESQRSSVDQLVRTVKFLSRSTSDSNIRSKSVRDLLVRGKAAAKNGDNEEAYYYLERVLITDSKDTERAEAWLWLSGLYTDLSERRQCLEQALAIEPTNAMARKGMAILDGRLNPEDIINPDRIEQTAVSDNPQQAQIKQFSCPRCNGRLHYTADYDTLMCEFCDHQQPIDSGKIEQQFGMGAFEQDFIAAMHTKQGHLRPIQMRAFQCSACAIEFVLTPEILSLTCPYCDSVYVTHSVETKELLPPQAIIPFDVSEEQAEKAIRRWFKQQNIERPRLSPIVGVYLPLWTFDIGGMLTWRGEMLRGNDWVRRKGEKVIFYDDVLAHATKKLPKKLANDSLTSFDLSKLVGYDARYLADWPAERYQISLGDAAIQARKQVLTQLRRNPGELTKDSYVRDLHIGTSKMIVESFKQVLLPMWIAHYTLNDKQYDVIVNGQTAVLFGQRPFNPIRKLLSWLKS